MLKSLDHKLKIQEFAINFNHFDIGDIVVHKDHGVCKFLGIACIETNSIKNDYVKLLYANDDKLYIRVENINQIKKFGTTDPNFPLDKLGGKKWRNRMELVKSKLNIIAQEIIDAAAIRHCIKLDEFDKDRASIDDQSRLSCKLKLLHQLTKDQEQAISDILEDLKNGKLMDRLICGDVGFGKTEIIMHAAFFILNGYQTKKQIVILAATTILCRQHYQSFCARFEGVKIAELSRFISTKDNKETKDKIKSGEIDIVIATHAILQEGIEFNNLGLVVVDEEHQFGVAQKEKLKALKMQTHFIALSATPIPRSLHMAFIGIKDLSIISTPPKHKISTKTYICTEQEAINAIEAAIKSGGSVFCVCPHISHIEAIRPSLENIGARTIVIHGKMPPATIDKAVTSFYDREFNVMLCTNIIQSGVDMHFVNTIVVYHAELFGLGQLHQLRGRVGRGSEQGYAYFIGSNKVSKLSIIESTSNLGGGFDIANYDADIRGVGNIVGEKQIGHAYDVGQELYQEMLKNAILKIKSNHLEENQQEPNIYLGIPTYIPDSYINDANLRLNIYRRASALKDQTQINELMRELNEMFGSMPEQLRNLFYTLEIKMRCMDRGIAELKVGSTTTKITLTQGAQPLHFPRMQQDPVAAANDALNSYFNV